MLSFEQGRTNLSHLRQKVKNGQLYQSLGSQLLALAENMPYVQQASVVDRPPLSTEAEKFMQEYQKYWHALEKETHAEYVDSEISDENLLLVLQQLAHQSPRYRDDGAFTFLSNAIQGEWLTQRQLSWMAEFLISDHQLFAHIFEPHNAAVYRRSFSILVLSLLLHYHRTKQKFLTIEQLDMVVDQVALYAILERDGRGFIKDNGWAHAFNHMSSIITELSAMPELVRADKLFLLATLLTGYRALMEPLVMGETQRIIDVAMRLANQSDVYAEYILLNLKFWRRDLVSLQPPREEKMWHTIYNRARFFDSIVLYGEDNVPQKIWDYVLSSRDFLV